MPGKTADNRNLYGSVTKKGELFEPVRLTQEVYDALVKYTKLGAPLVIAAPAAGISHWSVMRWIREGNVLRDQGLGPDDDIRIRLSIDLNQARAVRATRALIAIEKAANNPQNWTAAAWYLERNYPELYGRQDRKAVDWMEELRKMGITPEKAMEEMVKALEAKAVTEALEDSDEESDPNVVEGVATEIKP
jgi:hypothetical protein